MHIRVQTHQMDTHVRESTDIVKTEFCRVRTDIVHVIIITIMVEIALFHGAEASQTDHP